MEMTSFLSECVYVCGSLLGLSTRLLALQRGGGIGVMERYIRTDLKSVEKGTREKLV